MRILLYIPLIVSVLACGPSDRDSVEQAQEQNVNSAIDEDISKFLTEAADARMMDIQQGKLAVSKGNSAQVRQYGELMIKDQTKMLKELRVLAASKNIMLPLELSHKKASALKDLAGLEGEDFDSRFIRMMTIDHKRDVDDFEDAVGFKDRDIKRFARNNLQAVERHLQLIQNIEEQQSVAERTEEEN